jgi:hypothetical protein
MRGLQDLLSAGVGIVNVLYSSPTNTRMFDVSCCPDDYLFEVGFVKRGLVLTYDFIVWSKGVQTFQTKSVSTLSGIIHGSIVVLGT